jgi:predicted DsbA family dithiol-disulfide isomerase
MKIEMWADIICPWCGLGSHRLDEAVAQFAHRDELEVVHRSFQLDPSASIGATSSVRERLRDVLRMSDGQITAMTQHIEQLAESEGLVPYRVLENQIGSTSFAHELLAYATDQGQHAQAWHSMFVAYFGQAKDIFTIDSLVVLATEWGLDTHESREVLTSRCYRDRVVNDGQAASQLGATGVPFIVVGGRYGLSGAQAPDQILSVLNRAWYDDHIQPAIRDFDSAEDDTRGPEDSVVPCDVITRPETVAP